MTSFVAFLKGLIHFKMMIKKLLINMVGNKSFQVYLLVMFLIGIVLGVFIGIHLDL